MPAAVHAASAASSPLPTYSTAGRYRQAVQAGAHGQGEQQAKTGPGHRRTEPNQSLNRPNLPPLQPTPPTHPTRVHVLGDGGRDLGEGAQLGRLHQRHAHLRVIHDVLHRAFAKGVVDRHCSAAWGCGQAGSGRRGRWAGLRGRRGS